MNGPPYERLRNGHVHSAVIFAGDATRSPTPPSVILVAQALLAVGCLFLPSVRFQGMVSQEVVILCVLRNRKIVDGCHITVHLCSFQLFIIHG